jgi:hypothetical protein
MDQSTRQFLALADSPFTPPDKPDNGEALAMHSRINLPKTVPDPGAALRETDARIQRSGMIGVLRRLAVGLLCPMPRPA